MVRVCTKCHGPGNIARNADWDDQVADMVERGGKVRPRAGGRGGLSDRELAPTKVNVNDAAIDELKSVLGLLSPEAIAIVEYRQTTANSKRGATC